MAFVFEERDITSSFPGKISRKDESRGESVRLHYDSSLELNLFIRVFKDRFGYTPGRYPILTAAVPRAGGGLGRRGDS